MKYRVSHTTKYTYSSAAPVSHNQVRLMPRSLPNQQVERYVLLASPSPSERGHRQDYFGNQVDYFSIQEPHLGLTVTANSVLTVTPRTPPPPAETQPWEAVAAALPAGASGEGLRVYQHVFDSNYASASPELAEYARRSFTPGCPILVAGLDLMQRIHTDFAYDSAATTVQTPLATIFANRAGVCQDFAHIAIGCLRSLGLAARYVSGYLRTHPPPGRPRLVGSDASHAWFAMFSERFGWIDLDPTNNVVVADDHLTVAWGRDYGDVCPIQGVFTGGGSHVMSVSVDVNPITG